ncbi:hypothetical protein AB4X15_09635 [Peribacillus simplex]|uniref:hypothetical protein n=1 Tax=Peribacillus simplex TaxID=1478 RepID=UPI0034E89FDB
MDLNKTSILNNITGANYNPSVVDISKTLGNVLLSGGNGKGQVTFLQNALYQSLIKQNIPILIITNKQSSFSQNVDYHKFCNLLNNNKQIWNFDLTNQENTDSLNPFKEMNYVDSKDFIMDLFSQFSELDKEQYLRFSRYISSIFKLVDDKNKLNFNNLLDYEVNLLKVMVNKKVLPDNEKNRILRYLDTAYDDFIMIETYFDLFIQSGISNMLSGEKSIADIMNNEEVAVFKLDQYNSKKSSDTILKAILKLILKSIPAVNTFKGALIILEDIRFEEINDLCSLLKLDKSYQINTVFTVDDVPTLIRENGNSIIDSCDTCVVFNQNSNENCIYWSDYFGSYNSFDRSYSYSMDSSDLVIDGMTTRNQVKPIYRPEVFRNLKENEAIVYVKSLKKRRKIKF